MNNLTIYPDKELRKQLEKRCEEENRSLNNFIITILKRYFQSYENKNGEIKNAI